LLGVSELGGIVAHFGSGGFYRPEAYGEWGFVVLVIMAVTTVDALCAYLSHYLSGLLGVQEERSRALAAARADLLARNEREAARVRVLLEVAQHVSAMHTVEALLRAVCETTVALVRVPRVEIFLWDAGELVELVQGIARQAALALVNVRTMEQQQEDAEVSRVLLSLAQGLSSCLDEEALWQLLVRGASEVLDLPWSVAARFDERSGTFRITGGHGVPEGDLEAMGNGRFRLEDFPRLQERSEEHT